MTKIGPLNVYIVSIGPETSILAKYYAPERVYRIKTAKKWENDKNWATERLYCKYRPRNMYISEILCPRTCIMHNNGKKVENDKNWATERVYCKYRPRNKYISEILCPRTCIPHKNGKKVEKMTKIGPLNMYIVSIGPETSILAKYCAPERVYRIKTAKKWGNDKNWATERVYCKYRPRNMYISEILRPRTCIPHKNGKKVRK